MIQMKYTVSTITFCGQLRQSIMNCEQVEYFQAMTDDEWMMHQIRLQRVLKQSIETIKFLITTGEQEYHLFEQMLQQLPNELQIPFIFEMIRSIMSNPRQDEQHSILPRNVLDPLSIHATVTLKNTIKLIAQLILQIQHNKTSSSIFQGQVEFNRKVLLDSLSSYFNTLFNYIKYCVDLTTDILDLSIFETISNAYVHGFELLEINMEYNNNQMCMLGQQIYNLEIGLMSIIIHNQESPQYSLILRIYQQFYNLHLTKYDQFEQLSQIETVFDTTLTELLIIALQSNQDEYTKLYNQIDSLTRNHWYFISIKWTIYLHFLEQICTHPLFLQEKQGTYIRNIENYLVTIQNMSNQLVDYLIHGSSKTCNQFKKLWKIYSMLTVNSNQSITKVVIKWVELLIDFTNFPLLQPSITFWAACLQGQDNLSLLRFGSDYQIKLVQILKQKVEQIASGSFIQLQNKDTNNLKQLLYYLLDIMPKFNEECQQILIIIITSNQKYFTEQNILSDMLIHMCSQEELLPLFSNVNMTILIHKQLYSVEFLQIQSNILEQLIRRLPVNLNNIENVFLTINQYCRQQKNNTQTIVFHRNKQQSYGVSPRLMNQYYSVESEFENLNDSKCIRQNLLSQLTLVRQSSENWTIEFNDFDSEVCESIQQSQGHINTIMKLGYYLVSNFEQYQTQHHTIWQSLFSLIYATSIGRNEQTKLDLQQQQYFNQSCSYFYHLSIKLIYMYQNWQDDRNRIAEQQGNIVQALMTASYDRIIAADTSLMDRNNKTTCQYPLFFIMAIKLLFEGQMEHIIKTIILNQINNVIVNKTNQCNQHYDFVVDTFIQLLAIETNQEISIQLIQIIIGITKFGEFKHSHLKNLFLLLSPYKCCIFQTMQCEQIPEFVKQRNAVGLNNCITISNESQLKWINQHNPILFNTIVYFIEQLIKHTKQGQLVTIEVLRHFKYTDIVYLLLVHISSQQDTDVQLLNRLFGLLIDFITLNSQSIEQFVSSLDIFVYLISKLSYINIIPQLYNIHNILVLNSIKCRYFQSTFLNFTIFEGQVYADKVISCIEMANVPLIDILSASCTHSNSQIINTHTNHFFQMIHRTIENQFGIQIVEANQNTLVVKIMSLTNIPIVFTQIVSEIKCILLLLGNLNPIEQINAYLSVLILLKLHLTVAYQVCTTQMKELAINTKMNLGSGSNLQQSGRQLTIYAQCFEILLRQMPECYANQQIFWSNYSTLLFVQDQFLSFQKRQVIDNYDYKILIENSINLEFQGANLLCNQFINCHCTLTETIILELLCQQDIFDDNVKSYIANFLLKLNDNEMQKCHKQAVDLHIWKLLLQLLPTQVVNQVDKLPSILLFQGFLSEFIGQNIIQSKIIFIFEIRKITVIKSIFNVIDKAMQQIEYQSIKTDKLVTLIINIIKLLQFIEQHIDSDFDIGAIVGNQYYITLMTKLQNYFHINQYFNYPYSPTLSIKDQITTKDVGDNFLPNGGILRLFISIYQKCTSNLYTWTLIDHLFDINQANNIKQSQSKTEIVASVFKYFSPLKLSHTQISCQYLHLVDIILFLTKPDFDDQIELVKRKAYISQKIVLSRNFIDIQNRVMSSINKQSHQFDLANQMIQAQQQPIDKIIAFNALSQMIQMEYIDIKQTDNKQKSFEYRTYCDAINIYAILPQQLLSSLHQRQKQQQQKYSSSSTQASLINFNEELPRSKCQSEAIINEQNTLDPDTFKKWMYRKGGLMSYMNTDWQPILKVLDEVLHISNPDEILDTINKLEFNQQIQIPIVLSQQNSLTGSDYILNIQNIDKLTYITNKSYNIVKMQYYFNRGLYILYDDNYIGEYQFSGNLLKTEIKGQCLNNLRKKLCIGDIGIPGNKQHILFIDLNKSDADDRNRNNNDQQTNSIPYLLTGGYADGYFKLWDLSDMSLKQQRKYHKSRVSCLVFNQSNSVIIVGYDDSQITLWNFSKKSLIDNQPYAVISQHTNRIQYIDSHPGIILSVDGSNLAVVSTIQGRMQYSYIVATSSQIVYCHYHNESRECVFIDQQSKLYIYTLEGRSKCSGYQLSLDVISIQFMSPQSNRFLYCQGDLIGFDDLADIKKSQDGVYNPEMFKRNGCLSLGTINQNAEYDSSTDIIVDAQLVSYQFENRMSQSIVLALQDGRIGILNNKQKLVKYFQRQMLQAGYVKEI